MKYLPTCCIEASRYNADLTLPHSKKELISCHRPLWQELPSTTLSSTKTIFSDFLFLANHPWSSKASSKIFFLMPPSRGAYQMYILGHFYLTPLESWLHVGLPPMSRISLRVRTDSSSSVLEAWQFSHSSSVLDGMVIKGI